MQELLHQTGPEAKLELDTLEDALYANHPKHVEDRPCFGAWGHRQSAFQSRSLYASDHAPDLTGGSKGSGGASPSMVSPVSALLRETGSRAMVKCDFKDP